MGEHEATPPKEATPRGLRLPIALKRLNKEQLDQVAQSLAVLTDYGMTSIPDVGGLKAMLGVKDSHLPLPDYTSTYAAMNIWAWTPSSWKAKFQATEAQASTTATGLHSAVALDDGDKSQEEMEKLDFRAKQFLWKKVKFHQQQLQIAEAAREEALKAVQTVKTVEAGNEVLNAVNDVNEVKKEDLIVMFVNKWWATAKQNVAVRGKAIELLEQLKQFDKHDVPAKVLAEIEPLLDDPQFTVERVWCVSFAGAGLCKWVHGIIRYAKITKVIDEQRKNAASTEELEKTLEEAMPVLQIASEALDTLSKNDVTEVLSFRNPPFALKIVWSAICCLLRCGKTDSDADEKAAAETKAAAIAAASAAATAAVEAVAEAKREVDKHQTFLYFFEAIKTSRKEFTLMADPAWTPTQSTGAGLSAIFNTVPGYGVPQGPVSLPVLKYSGNGKPQTMMSKSKVSAAPNRPGIISVHLGETGCGIGHGFWNTAMAETSFAQSPYFHDTISGGRLPRAIFAAQADSQNLSKVRSSGSFNEEFICGTKEFCAGSSDDKEFHEAVRRQLEMSDHTAGVVFTYAGYEDSARLLSPGVRSICGKVPKWSICLSPPCHGAESDGIPETTPRMLWNMALSLKLSSEMDVVTIADDVGLRRFCKAKPGCGLGMHDPTAQDYQDLIARWLAAFTCPLRAPVQNASEGFKSIGFKDVMTNLVAYPACNFFVPSYGPIGSNSDPADVVRTCLQPSSCLSSVDTNGMYAGTALVYRGFSQLVIRQQLEEVIRNRKYMDWSPGPFCIGGLSGGGTQNFEIAVLDSNTALGGLFESWKGDLDAAGAASGAPLLGLEEAHLNECLENMASAIQDYKDISTTTAEGDGEGEEED